MAVIITLRTELLLTTISITLRHILVFFATTACHYPSPVLFKLCVISKPRPYNGNNCLISFKPLSRGPRRPHGMGKQASNLIKYGAFLHTYCYATSQGSQKRSRLTKCNCFKRKRQTWKFI